MFLLYVATRLLACKHPFLLVDFAVTIQIELLQKLFFVVFPLRQKIGNILSQVEIAVCPADGRELADRVDLGLRQYQPFCIAMVALYPAILAAGNDFCMFRIDQAASGAVVEHEAFLAAAAVYFFPFTVTDFLLDDESIPDAGKRRYSRQYRPAGMMMTAADKFDIALRCRCDF